MNLPLFISRKIAAGSAGSFSRTINKVAVVSVGAGLSVLLLAFMILFGFKEEIRKKIYSFSGHLIVTKYTLNTSFEETAISVNQDLLDKITAYPKVEHVQPYAMKAALLKTEEEVQGVILKGVDASFDTAKFSQYLIEGTFPDYSGEKYSTDVVLSAKIANYLRLQVGDKVLVYFVQNPPRYRPIQIAGIYQTGLEEYDDQIILSDLDLIRRINNWPDSLAGGLEIILEDDNNLEEAEEDLHFIVDVDQYVDKVTDRYSQVFDWLELLNRNVVVLFAIIIFVCGTSIISILLILIMERTQMIGVMKSLGATNKMLRNIFVYNGLQLILKGLFWGNLIGLGLGMLQYFFKIIPLDEVNYYMSHVPIVIDLPTILALNAAVFFLIGFVLLIPVAIITRIQPVQSIRFD
ncbi:MAG: FtsX-like permease family protein [Bacteroidota bacterium]